MESLEVRFTHEFVGGIFLERVEPRQLRREIIASTREVYSTLIAHSALEMRASILGRYA